MTARLAYGGAGRRRGAAVLELAGGPVTQRAARTVGGGQRRGAAVLELASAPMTRRASRTVVPGGSEVRS
ncbi:hypothetical protein [Nocardia sp. CC227C]|uniref:hypothetical protein n=1 Tax=Nocardia sp. CC227C TaxID=3044562 RepID=UPI00278C1EA3|nr:hypothetical protein [Nocardia sp. CC227C]